MTNRSAILIAFALAGALTLGCSGAPKKNDATSARATPSSTPPVKPPVPLSEQEAEFCSAFLAAIKDAKKLHLLDHSSDFERIFERGWVGLTMFASKEFGISSSSFTKPSVDLRDGLSICGVYHSAFKTMWQVTKVHKHWSDDPIQVFANTLRMGLENILQSIDRFSHYKIGREGGSITFGAGIQFLVRTDYEMGRHPNYLVVQGFHRYSPNQKHIAVGTKIYKIRDELVSSMSFREAERLINSPVRTREEPVPTIEVTVDSPDGPQITLKSGEYEQLATYSKWLDPEKRKFIYVRLSEFESEGTKDIYRNWLNALGESGKGEGNRELNLLLDLRGNGGGAQNETRRILEILLHKKVIIAWLKKRTGPTEPIYVEPTSNAPLFHSIVLLVDRGSASASEMTAAALKDYGVALIVGEKTYGKGIGQGALGVDSPLDGIMTLTNVYFFSPAGHSNQIIGVSPDIELLDPLNQWQHGQPGGSPWTMKELAEDSHWKEQIIPQPPELKLSDPFDRDKDLEVITSKTIAEVKDHVRSFPEPATCGEVTDPTKIEEEKDCLFDWGYNYIRALADVNEAAH